MLTLLWTILFCLGWRIITDEGQIFYAIREPFERCADNIEVYEERLKLAEQLKDKPSVDALKKTLRKHKLIATIGKPFVLCITCIASVWGIMVFVSLNGFTSDLIPSLILNCVSASFIQTAIWKAYVKYLP